MRERRAVMAVLREGAEVTPEKLLCAVVVDMAREDGRKNGSWLRYQVKRLDWAAHLILVA